MSPARWPWGRILLWCLIAWGVLDVVGYMMFWPPSAPRIDVLAP